MYRHDRNYEELFKDVRNKLDQVGFCAGETGHVSPDTPRSVRPIFSPALLICYEGLLADLLACLEYVHTGCLCQSGFTKERDVVKHFQFPKSRAMPSFLTSAD